MNLRIFSIFGKCFGSPLSSGYFRNELMPYTSLFVIPLLMFAVKLFKTKNWRMKHFLLAS